MIPEPIARTLASWKSRGLAAFVLVILLQITMLAQSTQDVIYLKNGSIIKGTIVEQVMGESIKVQTRDGRVFFYKMDEILKISKEPLTSSVQIQRGTTAEFSLGGGISFPTGPSEFKDSWKMGFNAGGGIGFSISPVTTFLISADYNSFPLNDTKILEDAGVTGTGASASIDGGAVSIFTIAGNARLTFNPTPGAASLYVVAGAGFFTMSASDVTVRVVYYGSTYTETLKTDNESAFYASFGAGLDVPVSETTSLFVEGRYSIGFTKGSNTSFVPIKAGIRFGF